MRDYHEFLSEILISEEALQERIRTWAADQPGLRGEWKSYPGLHPARRGLISD